MELIHEYIVDEPIKFILYQNNKIKNDVQNPVVNILKSMSIPSIPEGVGHSKALFIADKIAKWHTSSLEMLLILPAF